MSQQSATISAHPISTIPYWQLIGSLVAANQNEETGHQLIHQKVVITVSNDISSTSTTI